MAQRIADEVGPRVSIRATFENVAGSRHVDATFHLYDDAYVIVGYLDAAGRLRIVFPLSPGDDGLIQGNKIYRVRPFFAGFVDEYRWNYSSYGYRYHNFASQRDSYDAGLGYVFVIASWRPMRLDRITDGDRWQSYEMSDVNYMVDPREAIEELGGVLAGDNREAYTIEYARYTTTNYGTYSLRSIQNCYGLGLSSFDFPFGFGAYRYSPFGYSMSPCGASSYGFGYRRYAFGYPVGGYTLPTAPPPVTPIPFRFPATPITRRPQGADAAGPAPPRRPRQEAGQATGGRDQGTTPSTAGIQSRHRGLIAEDAGGDTRAGQNTRRLTADNDGTFRGEPRIQDMVGRRRIDDDIRGGRTNYGNDGSRRADQETRGFGDGSSRASGTFRGGVTREPADEGRRAAASSRESGSERPARSAGGSSSPHAEGSSGGYSRPAAPARAEPSSPPPRTSSPPPPPPRSEPASSSSSGERKKPGA